MEPLDFKIQLKPGKGKTGLAFLLSYHKSFTPGHRFMMSTGHEVRRHDFDPALPGKALKHLIEIAEKASVGIRNEGQPLTNASLKKRIELMKNRISWNDERTELLIWANDNVKSFIIPENVDPNDLSKALTDELTNIRPNLLRVVSNYLTGGKNELFGFWQSVVDGKTKPKFGKKLRPITITNKKQSLELVKEFKPTLSFEMTDMKFYNEFTTWLEENDYEPNSIGKHIKELKSILHLASKNDLPVNPKFIYWPVTRVPNEVVALNKADVLKIMGLNLSGTKADVRDIFIAACFTGTRIADFPQLVKENFITKSGTEIFSYVQKKTGAHIAVPVFPQLHKLILDRGGLPKMISEQNFRSHLKDVCEDAELNDRVVVRIREGVPEYKKKWEAISPHSARRTFASSLFYGWWSKPLPASFAMRYTGHKTEKSFRLYIGASEIDLDAKALEILELKPNMPS